jgi:hypothetical protein
MSTFSVLSSLLVALAAPSSVELVVLDEELKLAAVDPAGRVDLLS